MAKLDFTSQMKDAIDKNPNKATQSKSSTKKPDSIPVPINKPDPIQNPGSYVDVKANNETPTTDHNPKASVPEFVIGRKQSKKVNVKPFSIYPKSDLAEELDEIEKRTGYSRNEIVLKMIEYCVKNLKFDE